MATSNWLASVRNWLRGSKANVVVTALPPSAGKRRGGRLSKSVRRCLEIDFRRHSTRANALAGIPSAASLDHAIRNGYPMDAFRTKYARFAAERRE